MKEFKRIALLFGNNRGLNGTRKDIMDFMQFLMSPQGGAWEQIEIKGYLNLTRSALEDKLSEIRDGAYDYVILYFSGHGGYKDGTILEINPQKELIEEKSLIGLATKQLNILDCCRADISGSLPIDETHEELNSDIHTAVRQEYEDLIKKAAPQQVCIYSCREGESSYAYRDGRGSIYSQAFFDSAKALLGSMDIVRVYDCHERAAQITSSYAQRIRLTQNPEIVPAKCLYILELPVSFNPKCLK